MKERLIFAPNIPQNIALEFPEGKQLGTGNVMFSLEGGKICFLAPDVALKIQQLGVKPGETFGICKRWNGAKGRGSITRWDLWLTPQTEQARAKGESEDLTIAPQRSPEAPQTRRTSQVAEMPMPALALQPTGTDGPSPMPLPASLPRKPPQPGKIPFNVAFEETVKIVKEGLKTNGEVWNDEARQAIVSTILIAAANQGWVGLWEREAA